MLVANLLDRRVEAQAPNRKWVADFTYIWTAEGRLYVAVVLDLFSRRIVGWSMSAGMSPAESLSGPFVLRAADGRDRVDSVSGGTRPGRVRLTRCCP